MAIIPRTPGRAAAPPPAPTLATPVYILVGRAVTDTTLTKFHDALKGGKDIVVVNPKCRTAGGQAELRNLLVDAGIPSGAMAKLGWSTRVPEPDEAAAKDA